MRSESEEEKITGILSAFFSGTYANSYIFIILKKIATIIPNVTKK